MKRVMEQAVNDAIVIRQETPNDFKRVCEVVKSAFNDMADSDHSEHFLVDRLRKSDAYIPCLSLVATTIAGQIVGHILLSKAEVVAKGKRFAVLAVTPLSVLPEFQRKGIGGMLVREAHRRAAEMGYAAAVLLGHKAYYPRFGYKKASQFGIKFPFDAPDDCCMIVELVHGGLNGLHGTVCYSEVFHL